VAREHATAQATRCPVGGHAARRPSRIPSRPPWTSRGCWPELACPPRSHGRWYEAPAGRSSHVCLARTTAGTELPWPLRTPADVGRSSCGRRPEFACPRKEPSSLAWPLVGRACGRRGYVHVSRMVEACSFLASLWGSTLPSGNPSISGVVPCPPVTLQSENGLFGCCKK
jgi:hypothetical protein